MSLLKDHITIYDIARRAGVSIATVSRVLTGKLNVREDTREKVQRVIDECNYEPNLIARALCNRVSNTIGMLVEELSNPFFVTICNEAELFCTSVGYTLLFGIINSWQENETELERYHAAVSNRPEAQGLMRNQIIFHLLKPQLMFSTIQKKEIPKR